MYYEIIYVALAGDETVFGFIVEDTLSTAFGVLSCMQEQASIVVGKVSWVKRHEPDEDGIVAEERVILEENPVFKMHLSSARPF